PGTLASASCKPRTVVSAYSSLDTKLTAPGHRCKSSCARYAEGASSDVSLSPCTVIGCSSAGCAVWVEATQGAIASERKRDGTRQRPTEWVMLLTRERRKANGHSLNTASKGPFFCCARGQKTWQTRKTCADAPVPDRVLRPRRTEHVLRTR